MSGSVAVTGDVRHFFGLAGRAIRIKDGCMSSTYRCGTSIVQHVSLQSLHHHRAVLGLRRQARPGALAGIDAFYGGELTLPDGTFWRAARMIEGQLLSRILSPDMYCSHALNANEQLSSQLQELETLGRTGVRMPPPGRKQDLEREEMLRRLSAGGATARRLAKLAGRLPDDIESRLVLAHGDPVPKNMILTAAGAVLVDFEHVGVLPAHLDVAHCAVHWALTLDPDRTVLLASDLLARRGLPSTHAHAITVVGWGIVRDAAVWWKPEQLRRAPRLLKAQAQALVGLVECLDANG